MANTPPSGKTEDLSTLAWVIDEVRRSLDAAHTALHRYLKESAAAGDADLASVDPAVLRQVRSHIHQSVGALELVGLGAAAQPLRATEAAVQRLSTKPALITKGAVKTIERCSFALLDYLSRKLAGKTVSALSMFPQYRAVQELAGAARAHPADLWTYEWQWRSLPPATLERVTARVSDAQAVNRFEIDVLALMRGQPGAAERLCLLSESLAAGVDGQLRSLWQLAAAFFEALSDSLLTFDLHAKRVASRLLAQLRAGAKGQASDRLAQDLLFFCAQVNEARQAGRRLAAVRKAHGLEDEHSVNYLSTALGQFDPMMVAQARKRVAAAKEIWSAVAAGELARLPSLAEPFALVGDSVDRLYPDGAMLARALQTVASKTQAGSAAPAAEMAMEMATALLYLEASLDDADFNHPEMRGRVLRLADRLDDVRQGKPPGPLEPWMEELYRSVSDRQTLGNVVQELRASLSEVEKQIDQYFRDPTQRELLIPVPGQLSAMRGVLSLLDLEQASQAVLRMRDDVDALASTEVMADQAIRSGTFDRLADNLGALSFLIDMVAVQPQTARSLFKFDADTGMLKGAVVQAERQSSFGSLGAFEPSGTDQPALVHQARSLAESAAWPSADAHGLQRELGLLSEQARASDEPELAELTSRAQSRLARAGDADEVEAARQQLSEAIDQFMAAKLPQLPEPSQAPRPVPPPRPPAAPGQTGLEDDPEMREIFLEEAREVVAHARNSLQQLQQQADDLSAMTMLRRAFHTLKGSSRMVGLVEMGNAAWACEQVFNTRLADSVPADDDLRGFTLEALAHLELWVDAVEAGEGHLQRAAPLVRAADALRLQHRWMPLSEAMAASASDSAVAAAATTMPADLGLPPVAPAAPAGTPDGWDSHLYAARDAGMPAARDLPSLPESDLLRMRIPDLPSAADLDLDSTLELARQHTAPRSDALPTLDLPALGATPAPESVAPADFELDFSLPEDSPSADFAPLPDGSMELRLDLPAIHEAPPVPEVVQHFDLDLSELPEFSRAADATLPAAAPAQPPSAPEPAEVVEALAPSATEDDSVKVIGDLRVGIPLFNIFLNEADELSRRLGTEMAEWSLETDRPAGETPVVLAHSLAGSSATVGHVELSQLARLLEQALIRSNRRRQGHAADAVLFGEAAEEIRRLLHQFAAGFLVSPSADVMRWLADVVHAPVGPDEVVADEAMDELDDEHDDAPPATSPAAPVAAVPALAVLRPAPAIEALAAPPVAAPAVGLTDLGRPALMPFVAPSADAPLALGAGHEQIDLDDDVDAVDAMDGELFPLFDEEASELVPLLQARLREWSQRPADGDAASACMRTLHTVKGGARLAGAMRFGEMAHRLESAIAHLHASGHADTAAIERLVSYADALDLQLDSLRASEAAAAAATPPPAPVTSAPAPRPAPRTAASAAPRAPARAVPRSPDAAARDIDWSRFAGVAATVTPQPQAGALPGSVPNTAVRVRAPLLDRLVNQAGEVSITRSRIETDLAQMKSALLDLTDNLERLRSQLRDIELQAETQIDTRLEAARVAAQQFDPLEMDRFTRFQELTRMMAESVNDVATVQRGLQRTLQAAEDDLVQQARLTRGLQDDLLRTRMVEFDGLSERLYRVVRQAAKETGKQVRLDINGGNIEVDRGVLDRVTGAFEHLLRNSVVHGIEAPASRAQAGKDPVGHITIGVAQEGNEVAIEFRDDGAGLDLARIRDKAVAMGQMAADASTSDADLAGLIFQPGFTTSESLTGLAGRGVGMDVVRNDVNAMGGRIETATARHQGTSFRLVLPLTTAVTQVVMLRCGDQRVAVPSTLVESIQRVSAEELPTLYQRGTWAQAGTELPFQWLAALLQGSTMGSIEPGKTAPLVVIRSAAQRLALHVDEVLGNQEVVVKNLGPQLSRLPGLAGMTLLPSGLPALIYNPVALAALHGRAARQATLVALDQARHAAPHAGSDVTRAPLVLVVDDSLTVRRVTQRLLVREGYRVVLAKDGLEGLERLTEELPAVVLTDIEMPRMDGFDLVRNMRLDERLARLPVVMITSRLAQKHRDYAVELGVDHYLGKPYVEDDLLALVAEYTGRAERVVSA